MAKKQETKSEPKQQPQTPARVAAADAARNSIRAALRKGVAKESLVELRNDGSTVSDIAEVIPTGVDVLDHYVLGVGGLPVGRISEWFGEEACLDGDTFINYQVRRKDGKLVNSKGGTILRLFERFHGVSDSRGAPLRDVEFWAPSVNEEGSIVQNKIIDVVHAGVKECFELVTRSGERVVATADHEFFTGDGYTRLEHLLPGESRVFVHNTPRQSVTSASKHRAEIYVRHHPTAPEKLVAGRYRYKRLYRYRAVVEAALNGLDLHDYVARLNRGQLEDLDFLSGDDHIHHIDGDSTNDSLENLVVMRGPDHNRQHAHENHDDLRFVVEPSVVEAIIAVGPRHTYDVKMADPYRNVVADGIVVHNCGKTSFFHRAIATAQSLGALTMLIEGEFAFDRKRARELGVRLDDLVLVQPRTLEEAFDGINAAVRAHPKDAPPLLIVVDTLASIPPENAVKTGETMPGEVARIVSGALQTLTTDLAVHRAHLLIGNQIRTKFGVSFGNPSTTPGGHALHFYASNRVQFFSSTAVKNKAEQHIGKEVTALAVKSKTVAPFRKAKLRLMFGTGYDNAWSNVRHAKTLGLVEKSAQMSPELVAQSIAALERANWSRASSEVSDDSDSDTADSFDSD